MPRACVNIRQFNIREGGEVIKDPQGEQDRDGRTIDMADENGTVLDNFPIREVRHGQ